MSVMITRRGTIATEQALAPTITQLAVTSSSITFEITNNDAQNAVILYEIDDDTPDEFALELGAGLTATNIQRTGLTANTTYTVYAKAVVQGKQVSEIRTLEITTDLGFIQATGGTVSTIGNYKYHVFTSSGTFTVNGAGAPFNTVEYLIVGGGGSGGAGTSVGYEAGGGGAGGLLTNVNSSPLAVSVSNYTIVVGAGGAGQTNSKNNGQNSSAFGLTAIGGGGGAQGGGSGNTGGSGGGAAHNNTTPGQGTSGQGFAGGVAGGPSRGTGGGGAGGAGAVGNSAQGGDGGPGLNLSAYFPNWGTNSSNTTTGTRGWFAGGGSGFAAANPPSRVGTPGVGGGGTSSNSLNGGGFTAGLPNTGGGGGASYSSVGNAGAAGGSGIVIIRYEVAS